MLLKSTPVCIINYLKTMKNNSQKFIDGICTEFQSKHGRASCYVFPPLKVEALVCAIYELFNKKNHNEQVLIIIDSYKTRMLIVEYFKNKNITNENGFNYKIFSADYIRGKTTYRHKLIITVDVTKIETIDYLSLHCKFMLAILTKNDMNHDFIIKLRDILPEISSSVSASSIKNDSIFSPVEIHQKMCIMLADDMELYKKYNDYITISLQIFGDFDTIEKARIGDARINLSSSEVRYTIARNNGWSPTLDTTICFNKQIDDIYNPAALYERANNVYSIMRQRRKLVSDYKEKLPIIARICYENKDKRILIVSKSGEFASQITNYINSVSIEEDSPTCKDYHDAIESTAMLDDTGKDYIRYKTGKQKGEVKMFGSQTISNYNLTLFNANIINCLSIKHSSDTKLKIAIDVVIFTSPLYDDIIDFKKRFTNITFNSIPNIVYVTYIDGTVENDKLYSNKRNNLFTIVEDEEKEIQYDENTNDIIL